MVFIYFVFTESRPTFSTVISSVLMNAQTSPTFFAPVAPVIVNTDARSTFSASVFRIVVDASLCTSRHLRCDNSAGHHVYLSIFRIAIGTRKIDIDFPLIDEFIVLMASRCYHPADPSCQYNTLRSRTKFSDVTFVCTDGTKHPVHKVVLSVSKLFEMLFQRDFTASNVEINVTNVEPLIFEYYLKHVYGEAVIFSNWRLAMKFFAFIHYTETPFHNEEKFLGELDVKSEEYFEFIETLNNIYGDGIPMEIIQASSKYIKDVKDISKFDADFIKVLLSSCTLNHLTFTEDVYKKSETQRINQLEYDLARATNVTYL